MEFDKKVTTTKKNNAYLGRTESWKMSTTLEEICVDLNSVFDGFNNNKAFIDATASGYLDEGGTLDTISSQVSELEKRIDMIMYTRATQGPAY